jgi:Flp pilus assembly protein TadG
MPAASLPSRSHAGSSGYALVLLSYHISGTVTYPQRANNRKEDTWAPVPVPIVIAEGAMKTTFRRMPQITCGFPFRLRKLAWDESSGQALVEFALISPLVLMLGLGICIFAIGLNENLVLTNGTEVAAQQLSISRGQTSDPCQTVEQAFVNASPNLTASNLTFTLSLDGQKAVGPTLGASNFTCTSQAQYMVEGANETVTVSYPYTASFINWGTQSYTLSSSVQEVVE